MATTSAAANFYIRFTDIGAIGNAQSGMHTGTGLPANGALPTFGATALECVLVLKTGPYKTSNCMTAARSLCEARLDKVNCVCPS